MNGMNGGDVIGQKEKLRDILARDEYRQHEQAAPVNPIVQWLEKGWNKLLELLYGTEVPAGAPQLLAYLLLGAVFALLAVMIVLLARKLVLEKRAGRTAYFRGTGELERTSLMQREAAAKAAENGRYEEAVRLMFLALLLRMDEQGWVRAEKWKTNLEYAEELDERQPEAAEPFKRAAYLFENVFYGQKEAGRSDYERMADIASRYWREGGAHA